MDLGLLVIFFGILVGGVALGMLLSLARPGEDDAEAMRGARARRVLGWLSDRFASSQVGVQQRTNSGYDR
jgi:hypothetical protein